MKLINVTFWDDGIITVDYPFMIRYTVDNVIELYDLIRVNAESGFDYPVIKHFPTDSNWFAWVKPS